MRAPFLAAILCLTGPIAGADTRAIDLANAAEAALSEAAMLLADAETADDRVAALSATIDAYDTGLTALRDGLRGAAQREAALLAEFDRTSGALSRTLGALQSYQSAPAATVLLHPDGPAAAARAALLAGAVAPTLEDEASRLRAQLDELRTLRALQENAISTLQGALDGAVASRAALGRAMSGRGPAQDLSSTDAATLQALLNSADTLQGFATSLTAAVPEAEESAFAQAKGSLALPVEGTLVNGFNTVAADGLRRPGLTIATLPGALVRNPWPATLRYRGPFLDDGDVVIVEPAAGFLLVIAGLSETFGATGEIIEAGAPLGFVRGALPDPDQILIDTRQGARQDRAETVYIELRRGPNPVDPAEWFAAPSE
ncbi:MAG: peptidase M23 [Pseudomonadota bacterium]